MFVMLLQTAAGFVVLSRCTPVIAANRPAMAGAMQMESRGAIVRATTAQKIEPSSSAGPQYGYLSLEASKLTAGMKRKNVPYAARIQSARRKTAETESRSGFLNRRGIRIRAEKAARTSSRKPETKP